MGSATERGRFARATWANVLGNTVKIVAEGVAGVVFGSAALLADAAHSVADLVASLVVLVWGDTRFDAPDDDHPHGHARIEPLTALFVGGVIVFLGLYLLYESLRALLVGPDVQFSLLLVGAIGLAIGDMYLVYWYTARMNREIGSPALRALAADCLNDLYTSVGALVGILGVGLGVQVLDPFAGALVSTLVVYQGVTIARENLAYLAGKAAPPQRRRTVRDALTAHDAVQGVHELAVFYDGPQLEVEAHVEVDGDLTLRAAHDLETELLDAVQQVEDVEDVHLHLDPAGIGEWKDAPVDG
jgi:cation diffusion facilitator family transporter